MSRDYILILGAGRMGVAIAYDLRRFSPQWEVVLVDYDPNAMPRLKALSLDKEVNFIEGSADDPSLLRPLMEKAIVSVGATSYTHHFANAQLAIECGSHWVDLGGNPTVVSLQTTLHSEAEKKGVAVVPDTGLAPGLTNILVGYLTRNLDSIQEIYIRVGGLPQSAQGPLFYRFVFSPQGLVNEYKEPCRVIEDGELKEVEPLTGWEKVYVGPPLGTLEACHTSGGSSTLVETFLGKVKTLNYKTLRYPGHFRRVKLLKELGFFGEEELHIDGTRVSPRTLTERLLEAALGWETRDLVMVKVSVIGEKRKKKEKWEVYLYHESDEKSGLTAMAQTTGFSAAIIARLIAQGAVKQKGVLRQETDIPGDLFINEMGKRGMNFRWKEEPMESPY